MSSNYTPPAILQQINPTDRNPQWITLDQSRQRYFSGLDASVYFGDIFMGQLVSLDYQLQEMVMPLFAYGDYTMRRVVHGMRMVRGSFTIMFQQVNLFYQILNYLSGIILDEPSTKPATPPIQTTLGGTATNYQDFLKNLGIGTNAADIVATLGVVNPGDQLQYLAQLASAIKTSQDLSQYNIQKSHLEQLEYQKVRQWTDKQDSGATQFQGNSLMSHMQARLTHLYSRYETAPEGFDIKIILGKPSKSSVITEYAPGLPIPPSYAEASTASFDAFQDRESKNRIERALEVAPPWTTRKIQGVRITGMGQSLDDSGRPLMETYSFIASDLV